MDRFYRKQAHRIRQSVPDLQFLAEMVEKILQIFALILLAS